jgi:hypothetical protein
MTQCFQAIKNCIGPAIFKILPFLLIVGLFNACKNEETDLGLNLLPVNGSLYGTVADTFSHFAWTVPGDSIKTDSLSTNILGALNDPEFGVSSASLYAQVRLPEINLNYGSNPVLDSCVLILKYGSSLIEGQPKSQQKINVYRVTEDLKPASGYYQNTPIAYGAKLGYFEGTFSTSDSVLSISKGDTVMLAPQMRIRLSQNFGNELIQTPVSNYSSNLAFMNWFKGIALIPASGSIPSGSGAIVPIELVNAVSSLVVYYNDSLKKEFSFTGESERIQRYSFSNRPSSIQQQLNDPGKAKPTSYVQSMSGAKARINIPHLTNLVKDGRKVLVQEASITFYPMAGTISSLHPAPERFLFMEVDSVTGKNIPLIDLIDQLLPPSGWRGYTNYGGLYNKSDGSITFRFNRHLQYILDTYLETGVDINKGFSLNLTGDYPVTAGRFVVDNTKTKIRVVYNKL